jgi:ABC-type transport system involved in multi-copper enzyme maturation permease subunit
MIFTSVLAVEVTKLRRSRVTWITFGVYAFMVIIAGLFLWMMKNPAAASSLGLIGQKANFAFGGQPVDWPSFLVFIVEMGGIGSLLMSALIVTFVFGREYVEGTAKNMLALPIPRSRFVLAKIVVSAVWLALLTAWMVPVGLLTGCLVGLPGLTASLIGATTFKLLALAGMSLCCATLVAWVAVETRGYFAPLGSAIGTLVLASVFGHTGWGPWMPWSIVGLYSGAAGPVTELGWGNLAVIAATLLVARGSRCGTRCSRTTRSRRRRPAAS